MLHPAIAVTKRCARYLVCNLLLLIYFSSCHQKVAPKPVPPPVKVKSVDSSTFYLDTTGRKKVLDKYKATPGLRENLLNFYGKREFAAAWLNHARTNEYAGHFINLLNNEDLSPIKDSIWHQGMLTSLYQDQSVFKSNFSAREKAIELELLLSMNFFKYAARNWGGVNDTVLKRVNWFIERKKTDYTLLLDEFLSRNRPVVSKIPVYPQYSLLKEYLWRYSVAEAEGGWPEIPKAALQLKSGDSTAVVPLLKQLLYSTGDLGEDNGSMLFDATLVSAIKNFQLRHGLEEDGKINENTLLAMRVPLQDRIRQILINMERSRWVPLHLKGDYLFVNIPEFKFYVYRNSRLAWSSRAIVGKSDTIFNTVIFNDSMEFVVLNPYWNIPKNILFKEVIPEIMKDSGYLKKSNMEVVDRRGTPVPANIIDWVKYTDNFPYIVRERPGDKNSLGRVKFLFPNPYEIYFHDTPAKALFEKPARAYSHGCIRLQEPLRLAKHLFAVDNNINEEKLQELLDEKEEIYIKLHKKIPVFIAYFTAWVDRAGRLNFREDVYGHDAGMRKLLFAN